MTYYNNATEIERECATWLELHVGSTDPRVTLARPIVQEIASLASGISALDDYESICGSGELCEYLVSDDDSAQCYICDHIYDDNITSARELLGELRDLHNTAHDITSNILMTQALRAAGMPEPIAHTDAGVSLFTQEDAERIKAAGGEWITVDHWAEGASVEAYANTIWYPTETTRECVEPDCDTCYATSWHSEAWRIAEVLYIYGGEDIPEVMRLRKLGDEATESDIWDVITGLNVVGLEERIRSEFAMS